MKGKDKCKALKEIRRQIAEENDIPFAVSQCTHQGDCKGTCPKCEAELRYLERELAIRQSLGKAVAVVGISVGVCSSLTACSPVDITKEIIGKHIEHDIEGQMSTPPPYDPPTPYPLPDADIAGMESINPDLETDGLLPEDAACTPEATDTLAGDISIE